MRILAIDYGRNKVGVAVGDSVTKLVQPIKTIPKKPSNLQKIINDQNIKKIIIGVPGGRMDDEIKEFGKKLTEGTKLPVEFFDETLTTLDARIILGKIKRKRKYKKVMEDAFAAAIMLESYLRKENHV